MECTEDYIQPFVCTAAFTAQTQMDPIYQILKLDKPGMADTYPIGIQRQILTICPFVKQPDRSFSVAAFVHHINQCMKTHSNSEVGQKMQSDLCNIVYQATTFMGGDRMVSMQDLSGCKRFPPTPVSNSDKFHLCPGSHSTFSCPQALMGGSDSLLPAFDGVYAMMTPELLVSQCRINQRENHDHAVCGVHSRKYAQCPSCRTYLVGTVYPKMYRVMIQLLSNPQTSEGDKHTCRVQLATGLLTAAWATKPYSN